MSELIFFDVWGVITMSGSLFYGFRVFTTKANDYIGWDDHWLFLSFILYAIGGLFYIFYNLLEFLNK